jgi:TM2 domain-containing membrane protein YozV
MNDSTRSMMMYDAQKKSGVVAFLFWLFLGGLGAHRFYLGRPGSGAVQLLLSIFGWGLAFGGMSMGFFLLFPAYLWVLIDVFLISGLVRDRNTSLANQLSS